jgi:hypothetical protein
MFNLKLYMYGLLNQSGLLPVILGRGGTAAIDIVLRPIELVQDALNLLIRALQTTIAIVITRVSRLVLLLPGGRIVVCRFNVARIGLLAASSQREREHKRDNYQ